MIEVETLKEMMYELNGYKESNKKYNFFYDEKNNYRKVRIKENGFNNNEILTDNFVIGGICFDTNEEREEISELIGKLTLDKNQELKSKLLYRGKSKFEECIGNRNLSIILDWILDNGYIHYVDMDNFYYTIIDIVDSICADQVGKQLPHDLIQAMKSELYFFLKENIEFFIALCNKTNYPNIEEKNVEFFCNSIISLIENKLEQDNPKYFVLEVFRQLLKSKMNEKELIFLKDNEDKTIVNSYYGIRLERCIVFQNSYHIFDEENEEEEHMKNNQMILKNGDVLSNYEFINSKAMYEIQISDCIVSLIAMYLKFLTYNSSEYIDNTIKNMKENEIDNLKKLINLINKSDNENKFFISTVNAEQIVLHRNIMNKHVEHLMYK